MFSNLETTFFRFFKYLFADIVWIKAHNFITSFTLHMFMMMPGMIELIDFSSFRKWYSSYHSNFEKYINRSKYTRSSDIFEVFSDILGRENMLGFYERIYLTPLCCKTFSMLLEHNCYFHNWDQVSNNTKIVWKML